MTFLDVVAWLKDKNHDNCLILTHKRPDGDTLGCAAGLCALLRKIGRQAYVLDNPDSSPQLHSYIEAYLPPEDFRPAQVIAVDIADTKLLPEEALPWLERGIDLAIDHHKSHKPFAAQYYVDERAAACAEVITQLAQDFGVLDAEIATPLYVGLATDTGCFVYSSTTARTHRIAAMLMEQDIDVLGINKQYFQTKSVRRMKLEGLLIEQVHLYDEGRLAIATLTREMIQASGAEGADLEDIPKILSPLEGAWATITIKMGEENEAKISVRTSYGLDASAICAQFGGGGHSGAAGALLRMSAEQAEARMVEAYYAVKGYPPITSGVVVIDKPAGWTSHDVVGKCRGIFNVRRIGHGGTLDPMATGVLPVFIGRATRAVEYAMEGTKTYEAVFRFGIVTDTQDVTGTVLEACSPLFSQQELETVLEGFRGDIMQVPPMYSAVKQDGKKLYELARAGKEVERAPRPVTISRLTLEQFEGTTAHVTVSCSKGTYIRTLCHDIGQVLGCGAALESLRRTESSGFTLAQAVTLEELAQAEQLHPYVVGVDTLFEQYPAFHATPRQERRCLHGTAFYVSVPAGRYRVYNSMGKFLMLGEVKDGSMTTLKSFFEVTED